MDLLTFVFEYKGGTYVAQKNASGVRSALLSWAQDLNTSDVESFDETDKTELIKEVNNPDNELALLDGLSNAWCQDVFIKDNMYLINIIQTIP